jgi:hypothetical protein
MCWNEYEGKEPRFLGAATVVALLFVSGCDDKRPPLPPVTSVPVVAALPSSASVKMFVVDGESTTSIEMDAPRETLEATTHGGAGKLAIDFSNLANSRGEVKIDLSTITTRSFSGKPNAEDDTKAQTTHARTWLEVGDGELGKLDETTKEANRYAVYAIRSIQDVSATDVTKIAPTKDGADDVRTVTLTTKGELVVHGGKVEREADVEVAFRYDSGAAANEPKSISIRTTKPFRVVLAEHDIKPRDGFGKLATRALHLLGTRVADNAYISLDLRVKPQS